MSSEFDQENLLSIFVVEASDGMKTLAKALSPDDGGLPAPRYLQDQFILAHRIKGAAALYGYNGVADLCERLETLCERAAAVPEDRWPMVVGAMREMVHGIQDVIRVIGSSGIEDQARVEQCLAGSSDLFSEGPAVSESMQAGPMIDREYVSPAIEASILPYFLLEAEAYLSVFEGIVPSLLTDTVHEGSLQLLSLTAHALKVAALAVEFQAVGDIAQKMESCVSAVQAKRIPLDEELVGAVMQGASSIRMLLRQDAAALNRLRGDLQTLIATLARLCDEDASIERLLSTQVAASPSAQQDLKHVRMEMPSTPVSHVPAHQPSDVGGVGELLVKDVSGLVVEDKASIDPWIRVSEHDGIEAQVEESIAPSDDRTVAEGADVEEHSGTEVSEQVLWGNASEAGPFPIEIDTSTSGTGMESPSPAIDEATLPHGLSNAETLLNEMEELIQILGLDSTGEAIQYLTHTTQCLKEAADAAGVQVVGDIARNMEVCLTSVFDQRMPLSSELLDAIVQATCLMRIILHQDTTSTDTAYADVPNLLDRLSRLCDRPVGGEPFLSGEETRDSLNDADDVISVGESSLSFASPSEEIECAGESVGRETQNPIGSGETITEPWSGTPQEDDAFRKFMESMPDVSASLHAGPDGTGEGERGDARDSKSAAESISGRAASGVFEEVLAVVSSEYVLPIMDSEVLSYFLPEAEEYLAEIEEVIPALRVNATDEDATHRLFRAAHTLKGSAYTVDFQVVGDIAHPMEDCMVAVRERRIPMTHELLDALMATVALVRIVLKQNSSAVEPLQRRIPAQISLLRRLCVGEAQVEIPIPLPTADSPLEGHDEAARFGMTEPVHPAAESFLPCSEDYFLPELDPEVLSYFVPEAEEYLETLESDLLQLDKDPQNRELIDQLFRTAHTLKGSAYTVGFQAIGDLMHHVEDFMGAVRDNRLHVMPGHTDLILRALDVVNILMRRDPRVLENTRLRFQTALSEVKQLEQGHAAHALPVSHADAGTAQQSDQPPDLEEDEGQPAKQVEGRTGEERDVIRVSYARLERLMNLVGELVIGRGRLEQRLRMLERLSDQVLDCKTRMVDSIQSFSEKHTFTFYSAPSSPEIAAVPQGIHGFEDFGGLEMDKYDDFNILARRIGEVSADITEAMAQLSGSIERAQEDMGALQQLTRIMRDEIGRARMVPVGTPFTRFRRAIRETAKALDKQVSLVTSGEHTEVDTGIVEGLVDPLVHLVRNAVYHGIESPGERVARGKPPAGTIYLHAAHRGNSIVIEVEDDGAGLNLAKVREKAVVRGLASRERVQALSDNDVIQFIFAPGFSTAEKVGDQAGRGVGLDVVKRAIEGMKGHIEVESEPGVGTKFTLSLPLTLLITTALLVRVGNERYAFALSHIREVTVSTAMSLEQTEDRALLSMDGEVIEVQPLSKLLSRNQSVVNVGMPVVIVRTATGVLGLAVDELLGRQEIVIKTLGALKPLAQSCFAGATIDPEGRVILVVDPSRIHMRQAIRVSASAAPDSDFMHPSGSEAGQSRHTAGVILLIDDSLSIRKFVGRMLESAGYPVDTAVDGDDGIRKASEHAYRLVITDLEMPKFNGYEVVQSLRARPQTQDTPIVVMTTRAGEKHRQLAFDVGANAYIAKPIDEQALLDEVERWVGTVQNGGM